MQAKTTTPKPLVSVYAEKGVLAFRFSSKYNPLFEILDGKAPTKQRTMGLGLRESPENWKLAQSAALRIERDLSDSENWQILFDPTFVKYGLAVKYTSAALKLAAPIPEPEPEITVGTMWEDYLIWKQPYLEATTFKLNYQVVFTNAIKGLIWNAQQRSHTLAASGCIWDMSLSAVDINRLMDAPLSLRTQRKTIAALSEAFTRLQSQDKTKLTKNPFVFVGGVVENKTDKYKSTVNADGTEREWWEVADTETDSEENDRRAFTKDERDIIIKAFYESARHSHRKAAPLIEFLFLTGCRSGEAFALRWQDVFIGRDKDCIRFSKSYNGRLRNTQVTKTDEIRLFKMYPKLRELLLRIKPENAKSTDLVFTNTEGNSYNSNNLDSIWRESKGRKCKKVYHYPGLVTQLIDDGMISGYLSPYHTRHTFISLQAHAGADLFLLATICGNSVEVIQRHYLGINIDATLPDI
ncbi:MULTISPECIES: tyrosine-type recombinase/integrase [unclassified Microcoleus]|uniref:tyrosine-type recombinase/integrase n=1 Tax=unclassified Microcoleus TaxID=2642155 RepID=UPI002FD17994